MARAKTKRRAPSPTELVLVDGLLTFLSRRMAGALDLGIVLMLEPPPERYTLFVSEHVAGPMRAAAIVLRLAVAEVVPEPARTPFEAITVDTEAFVSAVGRLSDYASMSELELKSVVDHLTGSYRRLRDSFLDVAERLDFEPGIASDTGLSEAETHDQILAGLYDDCWPSAAVAARGRNGVRSRTRSRVPLPVALERGADVPLRRDSAARPGLLVPPAQAQVLRPLDR
jgi:hypothetical protein